VTSWDGIGVDSRGEHYLDRACAASGMEEHRFGLLERVPAAG
jgi:hypothetical protein